ncbi:MAG: 3-deoxy-manno-octulosonate cytidylyltransferase [Chitinophagaceae bacterium]|nr:3-deoxy-manno-octulosonate cytidylyltransferase [Chitinophagaceae bacterium]MCB9046474.1 3-deoxy-manno-octulosonate cytidylyltransferase [Chitinophagales bacterium]
MKAVVLIPARIGSTRFPAKMLAKIKGEALICRTWRAAVDTGLFADVIVVTDSDEIQQEVERTGGKVLRSKIEHDSGTDRIAEVAEGLDADVVINIQGDEPFIKKEPLEKLLRLFDDKDVVAASLVQETKDSEVVSNPNKVKVLLGRDMNAIYFSRSPVPYKRDESIDQIYYIHIGIYAFRKQALIKFASWKPSPHEVVEKLECNRFIDYGMPIKMAVTDHVSIAVDTPDDIIAAENYIDRMNKK